MNASLKKISAAAALFSIILLGNIPTAAHADSVGVLCVNSTSKAITVEKKCAKGTVQVTGNTIFSLVNSAAFAKCYTQAGDNSDALPSGKVAVALSCKSGFYVSEDGFDTTDSTNANPKLSSKTLIFSSTSKLPTGVQFEATGDSSKYYTLTANIICCPLS